jgi:hypothetical protein
MQGRFIGSHGGHWFAAQFVRPAEDYQRAATHRRAAVLVDGVLQACARMVNLAGGEGSEPVADGHRGAGDRITYMLDQFSSLRDQRGRRRYVALGACDHAGCVNRPCASRRRLVRCSGQRAVEPPARLIERSTQEPELI